MHATGELLAQTRSRVLLVGQPSDDVVALHRFIADHHCAVTRCLGATELGRKIGVEAPHLIVVVESLLLDLLDLCRAARGAGSTPVLAVGARDLEEDEILCLEAGATMYLEAGASLRRLRAYMAALLKRDLGPIHPSPEGVLSFGDLRVDVHAQRVFVRDQPIEMTRKQYELLRFLLERPGQAISRQAIIDGVWGSANMEDESRSLEVHIHWLRGKIERDAANPQLIRTVRGVGYCFDPAL
jgi:two-component system OmpR family response regulator